MTCILACWTSKSRHSFLQVQQLWKKISGLVASKECWKGNKTCNSLGHIISVNGSDIIDVSRIRARFHIGVAIILFAKSKSNWRIVDGILANLRQRKISKVWVLCKFDYVIICFLMLPQQNSTTNLGGQVHLQ